MYSISNNLVSVEIASKGAELQSIYHKQHQLEYMWGGDPAAWAKKSPVLFPIVGELKDKSYTYNGKQYSLSRHGFAREQEFEVTDQSDTSITFSISSNEQTKEVYPFEFVFSVKYTLQENKLLVGYMVQNTGSDTMYFSVGGHPAFKVPLVEGTSYEDYKLVFEETETAGRYPLSPDGLTLPEPTPLLDNTNELPLRKELFANDAIVFKDLRSTSVALQSHKTEHGLRVSFKQFQFLGIWETKNGDFVCIEPWCGIADSVASTGNLEEKEGINLLGPAAKFEVSFKIEVY